jgi:hypothetical protein
MVKFALSTFLLLVFFVLFAQGGKEKPPGIISNRNFVFILYLFNFKTIIKTTTSAELKDLKGIEKILHLHWSILCIGVLLKLADLLRRFPLTTFTKSKF